ncbi:hypothetical protein DFJ74DRAFT_689521 [Hyaloraphidium curvatum]|nr:hypothetical protein DFJ74DRAFT_689493 [Hyaloraphidium curvatum]KAI9006834.1 hypothetical protein DFJ74DRAFT_689521 [Hyaloraphidium curvatum]
MTMAAMTRASLEEVAAAGWATGATGAVVGWVCTALGFGGTVRAALAFWLLVVVWRRAGAGTCTSRARRRRRRWPAADCWSK